MQDRKVWVDLGTWSQGHNPVWVVHFWIAPKVAPASQPRAAQRNAFGIQKRFKLLASAGYFAARTALIFLRNSFATASTEQLASTMVKP